MSDKQKRVIPGSPEAWQELAAAMREVGTAVVEQMRESFGPRQEICLVTDPERDAALALKATLDEVRPLVVEATSEEMADPLTVKAKMHHGLKARVRDDLLTLCGFEDGAEVTADGSADNDLAAERADAVMAFLDLAQGHSLPRKLLPRGDRLGDWLPPGTPVVVHLGGFEHSAVVEPTRDTVTVRLTKAGVVTEYPRDLISKEGEPWTPPKRTDS